jgi:plastocyanin
MRRRLALLGGLGLAAGIACKSTTSGGNGCKSAVPDVTISVDNGTSYSLPTVTVPPGARVCWENVGSTFHSVTSDPVTDSVRNDSTWHLDGQLNPDLVVQYTFNKVGADYSYHCRYHQAQGMTGVIHVR